MEAQGQRKFLLQPLPRAGNGNGNGNGASNSASTSPPPSPSLTYPLRARPPSLSPKVVGSNTASSNYVATSRSRPSRRLHLSAKVAATRSWFVAGCFRPPVPSLQPPSRAERESAKRSDTTAFNRARSRFQKLPTLTSAFDLGALKQQVRELSAQTWQESIFRPDTHRPLSRQDTSTVRRLTAQLCAASAESKHLRSLVALQQHPLVWGSQVNIGGNEKREEMHGSPSNAVLQHAIADLSRQNAALQTKLAEMVRNNTYTCIYTYIFIVTALLRPPL